MRSEATLPIHTTANQTGEGAARRREMHRQRRTTANESVHSPGLRKKPPDRSYHTKNQQQTSKNNYKSFNGSYTKSNIGTSRTTSRRQNQLSPLASPRLSKKETSRLETMSHRRNLDNNPAKLRNKNEEPPTKPRAPPESNSSRSARQRNRAKETRPDAPEGR